MTCSEFAARLHPYVDGELPPADIFSADAHAADCAGCAERARGEREFRRLLRRQPRETAPPELRARIVGRIRSGERRARLRPWLAAPALAAAAAALVVFLLFPSRPVTSLVADLVDKHIAYAQLARPAELASTNPAEVEAWFRQRAGLRVAVPDYSPAGIQLIGARLAEAQEHKAAYLLYEKGHTLLSVFVVPVGAHQVLGAGQQVTYRGNAYLTRDMKGYRSVSWADRHAVFGLVSTLDYDALLECADRLRVARERHTSL